MSSSVSPRMRRAAPLRSVRWYRVSSATMMLEDDSRIASRRARSASAPRLTAHALAGHAQSLRRRAEPHAELDRCWHAGALLDDLTGVEQRSSRKRAPTSWTPTGSPPYTPADTDSPGTPRTGSAMHDHWAAARRIAVASDSMSSPCSKGCSVDTGMSRSGIARSTSPSSRMTAPRRS